MNGLKSYILTVILITLPILVLGGILWNTEPPPPVLQPVSPDVAAAEPEWWRGAEDAIVTIETFPDFECIACCETEAAVTQTVKFYPKITKVVYNHFPLSELGQKIAEGLEAAGEQGMFWELYDKVAVAMPRDVDSLKTCATAVGLDMAKFNEALDSGKFKEKVEQAKERAISRGVTESVIFVGGVPYHKYPPEVSDISGMIVEAKDKAAKGEQ
jgi:hypothetical protein